MGATITFFTTEFLLIQIAVLKIIEFCNRHWIDEQIKRSSSTTTLPTCTTITPTTTSVTSKEPTSVAPTTTPEASTKTTEPATTKKPITDIQEVYPPWMVPKDKEYITQCCRTVNVSSSQQSRAIVKGNT